MRSLRGLILALACLAQPDAFAGVEITAADIPKDAPRASDYPAKPYTGRNATPDVKSHPRSRHYRTQLRNWAAEKPNFAGHYILATWGCGTGCTEIAIIDAITGKVFHPAGAQANSIVDVDAELLEDDTSRRRDDFGALRHSPDSRLLVVFGMLDNKPANRGIAWFVWENEALKRIRFVAKR
jgi:hypothetical protein